MVAQPDIREYVERNGQGLPDFAPGMVYTINGERLVVIKVVRTRADPHEIDVQVEPYVEEMTR